MILLGGIIGAASVSGLISIDQSILTPSIYRTPLPSAKSAAPNSLAAVTTVLLVLAGLGCLLAGLPKDSDEVF